MDLGDAAPGPDRLVVRGDVGATASLTCAGALPWGQPFDQRPDEAFSLTYDWAPLEGELELLGYPRFEAVVTASAPVAYLTAKLCDVFEDGTSALVSRGILNLAQRDSSADPQPLEPGRPYRVTVDLTATSWLFEPGHRMRLDVAGADWPNCWAPPQPISLTIERASSRLVVPVVGPPERPLPEPRLTPPPVQRAVPSASLDLRPTLWRVEHDVLERESRVLVDHGSTYDLELDGNATEDYRGLCAVSAEDHGRARAEGRARFQIEWPAATVETEARLVLRSDRDRYDLELELDVSEDGELKWKREWRAVYPRRLQ